MPRCKNIRLTYQGECIAAKCAKGMSPLLWYMVTDGLLLRLNDMGYTTLAYADDLVTVFRGEYLGEVAILMQENFRIVDNCYKTK